MAGAPVLVGRDAELHQLDAGAEAGRHLLVVGDAGVGKSSLVAEWVAGRRGLHLEGRCAPLSGAMPLLPVMDALGSRHADVRPAVARALSGLSPSLRAALRALLPQHDLPGDGAETGEEELFLAIGELLAEMADARPVVLVVEDVHWADPKTLNLLSYLILGRVDADLQLVATFRSDESDLGAPAQSWLSRAQMSSRLAELRLEPLDRQAFDQQLGQLGVAVPVEAADFIFARSEGNPFFTEQLVAALGSSHESALPGRVAGLLGARLDSVSSRGRLLMSLLAHAGRPLTVEQLASVSGIGDDGRAAVEELAAAALVVVERETVRPRHALLREAALDRSTGLSADLHERLAVVLESISPRDLAPEAAVHYRAAGSWRNELRTSIMAADRAWDLTAFDEAGTWGQRVLDLWDQHPETRLPGQGQGNVATRTLWALDAAGRRGEQVEVAERLWATFQGWPDPAERGIVLADSARVRIFTTDPDSQSRAQQLVNDYSIPESESLVALVLYLGIAAARRGILAEAERLFQQSEVMAERCGWWPRVVDALLWRVAIAQRAGDAERSNALAARAEDISRDDGSVRCRLAYIYPVSDIWLKSGRLEDVLETSRLGLALAVEHGLTSSRRTQVLRLNGAEAALELGRVADAAATVDAMYAQPTRPGAVSTRSAIALMRARVDLLRDHEPTPREGNWEGFESDREQAVLDAEHHHWSRQPADAYEAALSGLHHLLVVEAALEHSLCGGLLTLAMRACADVAETARRDRDPAGVEDAVGRRMTIEGLRRRFVDEFDEDPFRPRDTIAPIRGDLAGWEAERKRVTEGDTVDDWVEVARIWSGMSYVHRAAYAWWRAAECAAREPLDRSAVAEALRHADELSEGHVPLRREVEDLARRCRVAGLGRAARLRGTGAGSLTDQENRVLRLVAVGLTDGDIANQLFISVRTVNVHVSNILRKLDVPNRGAAARWAHAHGLMAD